MYSTTRAQFQNSSVNETMIQGSSYSGAHIHDVTNYTYSNLNFPDTISDLYVATMGDRDYFYYKRTVAGNPMMILDEGIEFTTGRVHDAVILNNPDVAAGSAFKYCIAVAHSGGGGGDLDFYEWTTSGLNLVLSHNFSSNALRISLDAHGLYAYTVVWQEYPTNELYGFGGFTPQPAMYPLIGTNSLLLGNGGGTNPTNGRLPDVAMTKLKELSRPDDSIGRDSLRLYYTYLNEDRDECVVSALNFSTLMTGPPTIGLVWEHNVPPMTFGFGGSGGCLPGTAFNSFFYSYLPKIDAPDHSNESWAVIVQQNEFYPLLDSVGPPCDYPYNVNKTLQTYISSSYKFNGTIMPDITLNDGSLTGTVAMHQNYNFPFTDYLYQCRPTVAWSNDGQYIHYGWGKTQDHASLGNHDYIGLMFDPNPMVQDAVLSIGGDGYRIIDFDDALEPYNRCVAFTRQNDASNDLFIVFSADSTNVMYECVYYKHIDWNNVQNIGYRGENNNDNIGSYNTESLIQTYYPNPVKNNNLTIVLNEQYNNDELLMEVYNLTGRKLYSGKGKIDEINRQVNGVLPKNNTCVIRISSLTNDKSQTIKLISNN